MADDDTLITLDAAGAATEAPAGTINGAATDDALADLKSQFEEIQRGKQASDADAAAARQREAQARDDAQRARQEADAARTQVADTHLSAIESSLTAQTAARDAAKKSYKAAMEAGNWDEAAEAQERLTTAVSNIARLTDAKEQISVQRTQRTEATDDAPRGRAIDPVEAFLATRTPATQSWLRAHPAQAQAIGRHLAGMASADEAKLARKLIAADAKALAEDLAVDTPDYFSYLEEDLGLKAKREPDPQSKQTARVDVRAHTRRQSVPAAPVNGGGSPASGGSSGEIQVRLSKGQAEAAEDGTHVWLKSDLAAGRIKDASMVGKPIGVREMARRVHAMNKERPGIFENGNVEQ